MRRERPGRVIVPLLLSILIHLLGFAAFSLEIFWPERVQAKRAPSFRIVSVDQPKPDETLSPDSNSRFLSDANRRESGAGEPSDTPRLKREAEDRIPARRGVPGPEVAALPPAPSAPPAAKVSPAPPPAPPKAAEPAPAEPEPSASPEPPEPVAESPPAEEEAALPRAPEPAPEAVPPAPPAPAEAQASPPESVEPARPGPTSPEPAPAAPEPARRAVVKREEERTPPRKEAPGPAERPAPEKKPARKEVERERPEKKPDQPVEVAKLEKPETRPETRSKPSPPQDPLAMFRASPRRSGRPDALNLDISNEEAERIAKASIDEKLRKEEEGDAVNLDTRDFRYASYFAHIKRRIQAAWSWPDEARDLQGRLLLRFVLREDGSLKEVRLLRSSGYRILDDEAMTAVTKASPFRPFPKDFKRKLLLIEGTFVYERQRFFSR